MLVDVILLVCRLADAPILTECESRLVTAETVEAAGQHAALGAPRGHVIVPVTSIPNRPAQGSPRDPSGAPRAERRR